MKESVLNSLILSFKNGNSKSFDKIYSMTSRILFSTAYSYLKDFNLSMDIVQETYIKLIDGINNYDQNKNSINYLITITKNLSINLLNKRKKEKSVDFTNNEYKYSDMQITQEFSTPLMDIAKKILDEDEKEIVTLILFSSYKRKEVAKKMNIPIGTVSWKYSVALNKIKEEAKRKEVI